MTLIIHPIVALAGFIFIVTVYAIHRHVPSSRRRLRPWPGRGGIRGKGTVDLKRVRLPKAPSGASGIQRIDHNRCHEAVCVAGGRCSCHRKANRTPPKGGSALSRHAHNNRLDEPPVQATAFIRSSVVK